MKKRPMTIILFLVCAALTASGTSASASTGVRQAALKADSAQAPVLSFQAPSLEEPYYRIRFPFEVSAEKGQLKDLLLNGEKVPTFLIFRQGKNISPAAPLEKGVYDILLDFAWASGKVYTVSILFQSDPSVEPQKPEFKGTSPKKGGIPGAGLEGAYWIYTVEEEAGLERKDEVAELTLTAPKAAVESGDFIVFDGGRPIPYQIIEKGESVPIEKVATTHPVTLTYKIVLPLSAAPREKRLLIILRGKNPAGASSGITLTGEGLGKTVKTSKLALEFSPKSGQINTIESLEAGVKLYNKAGVIHWNPDVFVQGIAWDHSFDWNPPLVFEEKAGDFVYLNSRKGPMPRIQDVNLDVKYTLAAGAPYFVSETRLNFENDLGVIAVRNDEMVLYKELFDSLVYKDKTGKIVKRPLREKEGFPFGLVQIAPLDVDWVGLLNSKQGYGFFSLRLNAADGNFAVPGQFLHKAGTYFYAPAEGNYVYWVRPLIYTWADFTTNNLHTFVPKGSFFYEKNAYGVWRLAAEWPRTLDTWLKKLKNPLRVF